jgi:hypothetical protein
MIVALTENSRKYYFDALTISGLIPLTNELRVKPFVKTMTLDDCDSQLCRYSDLHLVKAPDSMLLNLSETKIVMPPAGTRFYTSLELNNAQLGVLTFSALA